MPTTERIAEIITQQREDRRRRNIRAMHDVHAAARRATERDQHTDADVAALIALLAPYTVTIVR